VDFSATVFKIRNVWNWLISNSGVPINIAETWDRLRESYLTNIKNGK
jgi:hypothetical protein